MHHLLSVTHFLLASEDCSLISNQYFLFQDIKIDTIMIFWKKFMFSIKFNLIIYVILYGLLF